MIKRYFSLSYLISLILLMQLSGCTDRGNPDELDIPQEEEYPKKDLP